MNVFLAAIHNNVTFAMQFYNCLTATINIIIIITLYITIYELNTTYICFMLLEAIVIRQRFVRFCIIWNNRTQEVP